MPRQDDIIICLLVLHHGLPIDRTNGSTKPSTNSSQGKQRLLVGSFHSSRDASWSDDLRLLQVHPVLSLEKPDHLRYHVANFRGFFILKLPWVIFFFPAHLSKLIPADKVNYGNIFGTLIRWVRVLSKKRGTATRIWLDWKADDERLKKMFLQNWEKFTLHSTSAILGVGLFARKCWPRKRLRPICVDVCSNLLVFEPCWFTQLVVFQTAWAKSERNHQTAGWNTEALSSVSPGPCALVLWQCRCKRSTVGFRRGVTKVGCFGLNLNKNAKKMVSIWTDLMCLWDSIRLFKCVIVCFNLGWAPFPHWNTFVQAGINWCSKSKTGEDCELPTAKRLS